MSAQPYEIEHNQDVADYGCAALISLLTGYASEEVWQLLPARLQKSQGWFGRDFIAVFREMGYDCSPRFKPFDPATPYPCLLRFGPTKRQLVLERQQKRAETGDPNATARPWWNVVVYNAGLVYDPWEAGPYGVEFFDPRFKCTSMMQVWISDL